MRSIKGMRDNLRVGMDVKGLKPLDKSDLMSRVYLTTAVTSYTVPFGARYCVAKVLGSGGHCTVDASAPTAGYYVGGGGGAYAKTTFKVASGHVLTTQVGRYGLDATGRRSYVIYESAIKAIAEGGTPSLLDVNGDGGASAFGDEIVLGSDPGIAGSVWFGGDAVGDALDDDSVLCAGNGAIVSMGAPSVALTISRYGGGGAVFYNGTSSTAEVRGKGGLIVLEFYNGDPR